MKSTKPCIFLFSAWYPTELDTLLGNFVQNHAKAISKFAQVIVIHPYEDIAGSQKQKFVVVESKIEDLVEIRVKYKKIGFAGITAKLIRFFRLRKAYQKGIDFAVKKYGKPDISHVNILTRASFPALRLKRKYKIPFIITEHWTRYLPEANSFKGFFRKKITQYAVKQAAAVTTVSSYLKEAMQNHKLYNADYQIVPNVVDTDLFQPSIVKKEKKNILHVSYLEDRHKNFSGILRVVNKLAQMRNDFVLNVVHDADNSAFLPFIEENNLHDFVVFHGQKSGKELVKHFNWADFFVLFSNFETQGLVLIESFACGKPVIATRTGGILDIVNQNNGILVSPKNEDELLEAMCYMLDHHQDYDASAIRKYAVENFSEEAVGEMFLRIYQYHIKKI
ncbi:MAG: glycosyltransferase [Lentimicrobiaceae bacterium]|nr:glycosyltransferase [Lentimicrobiaceae bacterium]